MKTKLTLYSRFVSWIDRKHLHKLKIKRQGYIGGCILIAYVVTVDGKVYFVRSDRRG